MTPTSLPTVDLNALDNAKAALEEVFGPEHVVRSDEPLAALLAASVPGAVDVGVVTAGLDDRPHELWLADRATSLLDVASGQFWTADKVTTYYLPPALLPELYAILGSPLDRERLVNASQFVARFKEALRTGKPSEQAADIPPALRTAIQNKKPQLDDLARRMRGQTSFVDAGARARLAAFIRPAVVAPQGRPDTAYVAVHLGDDARPEEVNVQIGATVQKALGAQGEQLLRQTQATVSGRWFMPHAMAALGYMVDRGLPLPASAFDPGLIAHVLDPDVPVNLVNVSMSAATLSTAMLTWLGDHKRKLTVPETLEPLVAILPRLDLELAAELQRHGLDRLVEADLAPTLPHLARLEREGGAWVGSPSGYATWEQFYTALELELAEHERVFAPVVRVDPYIATTLELLGALKASVRSMPRVPFAHQLSAKEEFDRIVSAGCKEAVALDRARALQSASGAYFWLKRLRAGLSRLQGRQFPLATGRWGYRDLPLHNLPKRSAEGRAIRSGLLGPPGHVLIGADYNGFEVRLLAALSRDPVLHNAAQQPDIHEELADAFFSSRTKRDRDRAKIGVYSIVYGQTQRSFWKSRPEMDKSDADALYAIVQARLAVALAYREQVWNQYRHDGWVTTLGGWRRSGITRRKAFNTSLQGLGADMLRWVLRRLGRELPQVGARIVHQAHDEVIVAVLPQHAAAAEHIVRETMTKAVVAESGIVPANTELRVNLRRGATWGDLA